MEGFPFTYENPKQNKTKEGGNPEDCDIEKA